MSFSENLKEYRKLAGFRSAKEFAYIADIPYSTYIGYENGSREPNFTAVDKIAKALGISPGTLLGIPTDEDPVEKNKQLVRRAGFQISNVSPPNCITVVMDIPDFIRKKYPSLPSQMPVAFSYKDFSEWVDNAMEEYQRQTEAAMHEAFYRAYLVKLLADMAIQQKQPDEK